MFHLTLQVSWLHWISLAMLKLGVQDTSHWKYQTLIFFDVRLLEFDFISVCLSLIPFNIIHLWLFPLKTPLTDIYPEVTRSQRCRKRIGVNDSDQFLSYSSKLEIMGSVNLARGQARFSSFYKMLENFQDTLGSSCMGSAQLVLL